MLYAIYLLVRLLLEKKKDDEKASEIDE